MFCIKCGTQLPDQANFCWKCGTPQNPESVIEEIKYEVCEIAFEEKFGVLASNCRFWGKVIGPNGQYSAGESVWFNHRPSKINNDKTQAALDDFCDRLLKDGWEFVGTFGLYYQKRFRRRVKSK